ncbi:MAG TPA: carboxypeptidase regulatory-like domain-containing protein, partial [Candidatus Solibacter sp.]|nr:carboxypeptidase regulatory-like domain-containing protein [Candidatus Solibacter sp.]
MVSKFEPRVVLCVLLLRALAFSQNPGASVSGTVTDPAGAVVPAAHVEARNVVTGIVSATVTNEAGVYVFATLNPGLYQVTAEHPGFQKYSLSDLNLEVGAKLSVNINLKVGATTDTVEVRAGAAQEVAYATSSVGAVINAQRILELPIAGRNALDLLKTQPGVSGPNGGQNFSGARSGSLNVTIDGTNVQDNLLNALTYTNVATSISVDRVEEFRVVTSPADAELGRGSGQIMAITRSGGNAFHGSLFNEHRDRSLNANSFFNNLRAQPRDRLIRNFFGGRIGGPVKKNRTFFNFFYEERLERFSQTVTSTVLTSTARQGLWRFYPGVRNGNANAAVPTVDLNGNPVIPIGATGDLQAVSVFGRDPNRPSIDPSGAVQSQLALMPLPNDFRAGDGLNTAGYTWNRARPYDFNQFDVRIDHQFTAKHRASFVYSEQGSQSTNFIGAQRYPTVPGGQSPNSTTAQSFTLTSVLRPNLLGEFHAGVFRPKQTYNSPWIVAGTGVLPRIGNQPYLLGMSLANSPINTSVGDDPSTRTSPVYQAGESVSWIKGRHNFKGGFEVRYVSSAGYDTFNTMPRVALGAGAVPVQNITTIPGLGQNTGAQTLLTDLAGSVNSVTQVFNSSVGANAAFLPGLTRYQHIRAPEYSGFFKDDFHVSPSLTLNLGIRYELYAVPVENTGRGAALQGGSAGIFGISGSDFGALFHPGVTAGSLTTVRPIGPGTANPDEHYFAGDHNNFGPAVGLAWTLPWLGRNKTVLRAGYGIGYERNPLFLFSTVSGQEPGYSTIAALVPSTRTDLTNLKLPLTPAVAPLAPVGFTDRTSSVFSFDSHLRTPYYQNFSVSLSRELSPNTLLDLRWVGNKGTKLIQDANINEVNAVENGILNAFQITQRGGNAPLFDTIFAGISGVGSTITGSDLVRSPNGGMQGFLANNDVGGFANFLNTTTQITGQPGGLLRRVGLA